MELLGLTSTSDGSIYFDDITLDLAEIEEYKVGDLGAPDFGCAIVLDLHQAKKLLAKLNQFIGEN